MVTRRHILQSGLVGLAALLAPRVGARPPRRLGFSPVPTSSADALIVPEGYRAELLLGWGDPIGLPDQVDAAGLPLTLNRSRPTAARQLVTAGTGHDGLELLPLPARPAPHAQRAAASKGSAAPDRLLLALNHEFAELSTLWAYRSRLDPLTADDVALALAAHGLSIFEILYDQGTWRVTPSRLARRITGTTPMRISGPAAGSPLLVTAQDPLGRRVLGTLANCGTGQTPWGTVLTCEENIDDYFRHPSPSERERRYGLRPDDTYPFYQAEPRFDAGLHPHEPNRFGWVVELDPYDPGSTPVKRTALGRFKHETATCRLDPDGALAVYMGDDEAFEFLYKFVPSERLPPDHAVPRDLLDRGTLYCARLDPDGAGRWLPLVHASLDPQSPLDAAAGFANQAEVLVFARLAATALGATPLDRPEWIALHPDTRDAYAALTNNRHRGTADHPTDAANPRGPNPFGQILRWREDTGAASTTFRWDLFALAGPTPELRPGTPSSFPPTRPAPAADAFACPDCLRFGPDGRLWIGTDAPTVTRTASGLGHNQLLCADPATGELRRFLTAPRGSEVTGHNVAPDNRTLFVAIQHPTGDWPDGPEAPPRSALVAIRREDGGPITG